MYDLVTYLSCSNAGKRAGNRNYLSLIDLSVSL